MNNARAGWLLGFAVLAAAFAALDLLWATQPLDLGRLHRGGVEAEAEWLILREIRIPRVVAAAHAGAALATAGLLMQTYFRNALAGPYVLGLNTGASLAVALKMLGAHYGLGLSALGTLGNVGAAAAGAAGTFMLILAVARHLTDPTVLLVFGLLFGYAAGGITSVLVQFADPVSVQAFMAWTYGSFGAVTRGDLLWLVVPAAIVVLGAAALGRGLDALALGSSYAASLGVHVPRIRLLILALVALAAGAVTAFCGPVAFVGVATPHLCRPLLRTGDHRLLVPGVALAGATLALAADVLAHVPNAIGAVLPLNAVLALLGTPVITWVLLRRGAR